MWQKIKVLVIDDDEQRRHDLETILSFLGEPCIITTSQDWQKKAEAETPESEEIVTVLMGACDQGSTLKSRLEAIHAWDKSLPVVLVGEDAGDIDESWCLELRHSVIAELGLPLTYNKLLDTLHRAQRYHEAMESLVRQPDRRPTHLFRSLVGTSRQIKDLREMMAQVADKDVTVLINGESGTGKEVVARNLHYHSNRREKPFVPVNCGAIPAELLESELFGHEKGAFTGAISSRSGRFELAEGGTLFLDEIGDMPLNMQVKILRVLQEKSFERVGGTKSFKTDVRIIAATHRNLEDMIDKGEFREDLYYRLNVFPLETPALKERIEDIPLLIAELVSRLESEKRGSIRFNSSAIMSLCQHRWSGNVRELANLVERMAIMHPYGVIGVQDLPVKYRHIEADNEEFKALLEQQQPEQVINVGEAPLIPDSGINLKEYLAVQEKNLIQQALDDTGGVVARAADRLQIRRTTLVEKMRKYDLSR